MILKGSQRAGGADLALHLMNALDNERIEIGQLRGTVADDLYGALGEYEAFAAGTRCKEPLYSLSINPSAPLTREQYLAAVDRIERGLGLSGQPRAVIFHVKEGREHCHVVWSRIDGRTLKAVPLSHDRMKLRALSRELAREFGLRLPDGLEKDLRDRRLAQDRKKDARQDRAERMAAKESGITPEERRAVMTEAFRRSDSAQAFRAAISQKGYVLARGDRRDYVVVDRYGHVHSLARQIEGGRTRDVKAKLAALPPEKLPSVQEARRLTAERQKAADDLIRQRVRERLSDALASLSAQQRKRREKLVHARQDLNVRHAQEKLSLHAAQEAERLRPFTAAAMRLFTLMESVPALRSILSPILRNPKLNPLQRHRLANDSLRRRHHREQRLMNRRDDVFAQLEMRERKSLRSQLTKSLRAEERQRARDLAQGYDQLAANSFVKETTRLSATFTDKAARPAKSGADAWKERQEKLAARHGMKQKRPRGYRFKRDEPS